MKAIKQYDEIINGFENEGKKFDPKSVDNIDLFDAYYKSVHKNKNSILDFDDVIWEDRIPELYDAMLAHGIRDFAVSSSQSGIQNIITEFMDCGDGMELVGMTLIHTGFRDMYTGKEKMAKAFLLHIIDLSKYEA